MIAALAATAFVAPWRTGAAQQATTCAGEPYLARTVHEDAAATPAANLQPSIASPADAPAASPAATPTPLTIAWLAGASDPAAAAAARAAAAVADARLAEPEAVDPARALRAALRQGAQAVIADDQTAAAIASDLAQAAADGVSVVTLGADDADDGHILDVESPDGPAVATAAAQWLSDALGCTGEVVIVSGAADDAALADEATAAANEFAAYGVRVVDVVYGEDDPKLSFTRAAQTMIAYPDLGGILALTPRGIAGAADAVAKLERAAKMTVVGVAAPGEDVGHVVPIVTWRPADAAYLAVQAAAALVNGAISGAPGEQIDAGSLGDVVIGDAGVVAAPPIVVVPASGLGTPTP
ncbi:MAG TPA: substrate-binding domain-containing protein, partial [Thermomicrobiales bacterium]|nr:substrate-binding domain-containing protein [Thermomicrobiales bacterium]